MSENPYEAPLPTRTGEERVSKPSSLTRQLLHPANFLILIVASLQFLVLATESPQLATIFVSFTLFGGMLGHFFYQKLIHQRWAVHFVVLSLFNLALSYLAWIEGSFSILVELPFLIPGAVRWSNPTAALTMTVALLLVIGVILSHSFWPSIRTALLSALGWGLWYSASLMVLNQAG